MINNMLNDQSSLRLETFTGFTKTNSDGMHAAKSKRKLNIGAL
jgi:hypothetical protein